MFSLFLMFSLFSLFSLFLLFSCFSYNILSVIPSIPDQFLIEVHLLVAFSPCQRDCGCLLFLSVPRCFGYPPQFEWLILFQVAEPDYGRHRHHLFPIIGDPFGTPRNTREPLLVHPYLLLLGTSVPFMAGENLA